MTPRLKLATVRGGPSLRQQIAGRKRPLSAKWTPGWCERCSNIKSF